MSLIKKILHKLNGLHYPQDYLCLARESFSSPLQVYLLAGNHTLPDFINQHVFAGYKPVIFALYYPCNNSIAAPDNVQLAFCSKPMPPNESFEPKDAIALLSLKKIREQQAGTSNVVYYEGIKGEHHFVSGFHQSIISLNNRLYNNKRGNVFLKGNLLSQVQIAYAVPRNISLISAGEKGLYNLFPTDLHGPIGKDHYLVSLRYNGKTCRQVETFKKIIISSISACAYKTAYSLGKNHMQDPKQKDQFPFGALHSATFQLPLPEHTLAYRELELEDSFIHGIHKLLLFKTVYQQSLADDPATLAHIHNSYATWRYNNRLAGNYLLR